MAISWYYINDYLAIGVDWNASSDSDSVDLAPIIYRWDKYRTDNYGGSFDEYLSPDPSGAGAWYDLDFGSGSGTREIDSFATRTYSKGHSSSTVSLKISWTSIGTYYSGSYHSIGSGSHTWTYTVPARASYSVTYSANSGSGAPSAQTKWYGESLTLSTTKPTRTGYTFQGWGTSASDTSVDYAAGASYTGNANLTLHAIWKGNTYSVSYDLQGGTGDSSTQYYTYCGDDITLHSAPTKENYTFLGWSLSADAATATYSAGQTWRSTNGENYTLYAIWELAYVRPTISDLNASRCLSDGTVDDFGTYALVSFSWECCQLVGSNPVSAVKVEWKESSATTWSSQTVSASGNSGTVSVVVGAGAISVDGEYAVRVTVTDSKGGSTPKSGAIATANFIMDFLAGGNGIAIGKAATVDGALDVYKTTIIRGSEDASASAASGQLIVGEPDGLHIAMDNNEIMAKSSATATGQLNINADGGKVSIGGTLHLTKTTDSSGTADNDVALIVGNRSGAHLSIDGNEINAKASGTTTASLNLNTDGGIVAIGSGGLKVNGRQYGVNKVLWSGVYYMQAEQTCTLSEAISAQPNGIVLAWSWYDRNVWAEQDYDWVFTFIPKWHVINHPGRGFQCDGFGIDGHMAKYVYPNDTTLTGYSYNDENFENNGITFNNNNYVLRYVIGV